MKVKTIELQPTARIDWRQTMESSVKGKMIVSRVYKKKAFKDGV